MLKKGSQVELEGYLNRAARLGHFDIVRLLLKKGVDVGVKGLDGQTIP